jgi:hypothetical protein
MNEHERSPLEWPAAQHRTDARLHVNLGAARKTWHDYMKGLAGELDKMKVTSYVVTFNNEGKDPGVAVWFDRKKKDDFNWQDVLELESSYPLIADIERAYKRKMPAVHPDLHRDETNFDLEPYHQLERAKREAVAFVKGTSELPKGFVIPCDAYEQRTHNLYAILRTIKALRDIERFGAGQLFEGALHGFAGALPEKASETAHV